MKTELLRVALMYGDPSGDGNMRLARFLALRNAEFSPVILGNEKIYTSALSKTCPDLIDRFPVYDVPVGKILLGEANEESGRAFLETAEKLPLLIRKGVIDAALVLSPDEKALLKADRRINSDLALWEHVFPAKKIARDTFLADGKAVYLYRGVPIPLVTSEDADAAWVVLTTSWKTLFSN